MRCNNCKQVMQSDWYVYAVVNKKGERTGKYVCGICARNTKLETIQLLTVGRMGK